MSEAKTEQHYTKKGIDTKLISEFRQDKQTNFSNSNIFLHMYVIHFHVCFGLKVR